MNRDLAAAALIGVAHGRLYAGGQRRVFGRGRHDQRRRSAFLLGGAEPSGNVGRSSSGRSENSSGGIQRTVPFSPPRASWIAVAR